MVNLDNLKIVFLTIILFLFCSCNVNRDFTTVLKNTQKGMTIVPLAIAESTVDAADEIYRIDSLPDGTTVTIKKMDFRFTSKTDTFALALNDISFQFKSDTLYFKNLTIPPYNGYVISDTLTSFIACLYQTPKSNTIQCFEGTYLISGTSVVNTDKYKACMSDK